MIWKYLQNSVVQATCCVERTAPLTSPKILFLQATWTLMRQNSHCVKPWQSTVQCFDFLSSPSSCETFHMIHLLQIIECIHVCITSPSSLETANSWKTWQQQCNQLQSIDEMNLDGMKQLTSTTDLSCEGYSSSFMENDNWTLSFYKVISLLLFHS